MGRLERRGHGELRRREPPGRLAWGTGAKRALAPRQVGGKRGRASGELTRRSPSESKQTWRDPSPREPGKGPSQPQNGNGAASLPPSGSRLQGLSLVWGVHVRAWRPIWTRTALGGMQDVLDWLHGGIREPGLQPPPRPRLAPEAWHTPDLTNPRKSGQLFPNTTLGRPRTWLSRAG